MKKRLNQKFALIVAGGTGSRMLNTLPKQFMRLDDKPVLAHSISAFFEEDQNTKILVMIRADMRSVWAKLCEESGFNLPYTIVESGQTRLDTVYEGLKYLKKNFDIHQDALIAIHDAARPLVQQSDIEEYYELAAQGKSVVPAQQSTCSVRIGDLELNNSINRDTIWLVQTPQVFNLNLLIRAYDQAYKATLDKSTLTDDASVMELMGEKIHIALTKQDNIKITYPEDIEIAELYLKRRKKTSEKVHKSSE